MAKGKLSQLTQRAIELAVDALFERAKARLLGPDATKRYAWDGKALVFKPRLSLPGLYEATHNEHSTAADTDTLASLLKIAGGYLDATKERTKARVMAEVSAFVRGNPKAATETALQGKLTELWKDVHHDVQRIVETEAQTAHNVGAYEAAGKIAALRDIKDPVMFFVVVRDGQRCGECTRLHLLDDKRTPRVWLQSEIGSGYHTKGDPTPKIAGLHPNCRCRPTLLMPGYGFDGSGMVVYKGPNHDELARQRG